MIDVGLLVGEGAVGHLDEVVLRVGVGLEVGLGVGIRIHQVWHVAVVVVIVALVIARLVVVDGSRGVAPTGVEVV